MRRRLNGHSRVLIVACMFMTAFVSGRAPVIEVASASTCPAGLTCTTYFDWGGGAVSGAETTMKVVSASTSSSSNVLRQYQRVSGGGYPYYIDFGTKTIGTTKSWFLRDFTEDGFQDNPMAASMPSMNTFVKITFWNNYNGVWSIAINWSGTSTPNWQGASHPHNAAWQPSHIYVRAEQQGTVYQNAQALFRFNKWRSPSPSTVWNYQTVPDPVIGTNHWTDCTCISGWTSGYKPSQISGGEFYNYFP